MSGGRLVVLDRGGRAGKRYSLPGGLATLGAHPACDIRVLQRAVQPRHATVVVHAAQTVVRNVGSGETLVNGAPVSVAALRHGDVISLGGRRLRWEYAAPPPPRPSLPALPRQAPAEADGGTARRGRRATSGGTGGAGARARSVELALELRHRASAPAAHGRQVAVVQPLRRHEQAGSGGVGKQAAEQTQAALWIESRKSSARRRSLPAAPRRTPRRPPAAPRASHAGAARTPLRRAVLRRAQSASTLGKIQPPLHIDRTKRAAIMLMTGHTPMKPSHTPMKPSHTPMKPSHTPMKPSPSVLPDKSASFTVKKQSPVRKTPRGKGRRSGRSSDNTGDTLGSEVSGTSSRTLNSTSRRTGGRTVTILEITDSTHNSTQNSTRVSAASGRARSPPLPSARKSAMRDRSRARPRPDTITFDLGNLAPDAAAASDEDLTLQYSEDEPSRLSRAGRMLAGLGASVAPVPAVSPAGAVPARRSRRSGLLVRRALQPDSYSVVDLVSLDSNASLYGSVSSGAEYRTPRASAAALACSTPYAPPPPPPPPRRERSRSRINDTVDPPDLEDDSPRSSRRSAWRSAADLTTADTTAADLTAVEEGPATPERRRSPSEPGTPVLSIQSLLESSRVSSPRAPPPRRHTAPPPRPAPPRRSLRRAPPSREVTPRAAVSLAPEAVKDKHSSAKRPHSRRSIIDDLDRSDVVKHLFSSPVKRKLSRSMVEFSRRHSPEPPPRRRTPAAPPRTPPASPPDVSHNYTPERFVSPIDALSEHGSPDTSVDSRPSPRARRSIHNSLSDVRGVKALFARAPRDRYSDVCVKETFARAPADDLRRVTGVRDLYRRAPRNELTDLGGVRDVFRRSPENDLRNVSGVKRTLRRAGPRDELSDLHGVRALFAARAPPASPRLSGVGALFRDRSELLFDELAGRPGRSVYSKTFSTARRDRTETVGSRSLRGIDFAPDRVEEWLQSELKKRFRGDEGSSASPANSSELRRLATATRQGAAPVLANRTRNSSARDKQLPLKKRSLRGAGSPAERPSPNSSRGGEMRLPLTRRGVQHSTPVKGRARRALHDQLRRVSPIPAHDSSRSSRVLTDENRRSSPAKARTPRKQETPRKIDVSGRHEGDENVEPPRPAAGGRTEPRLNTRRRRSSLVLGKKAPAMRPSPRPAPPPPQRSARLRRDKTVLVLTKPSPRLNPASAKKPDASVMRPRRGRRTAANAVVEEAQPAAEVTRKARAAAPPEPELQTRKKRGRVKPEQPDPTEPAEKLTRPRRNKAEPATNITQPSTRTRAAKVVETKPTNTRSKKTSPKTEPEVQVTTKTRRGGKAEQLSEPEPSRTRRTKAAVLAPPRNTRKRKSTATEEVPAKVAKTEAKSKKETTVKPAEKRKRTAKENIDQNIQTKKSTRAKKTTDTDTPEVVKPTRGRKLNLEQSVQEEKKSTRTRRTAAAAAVDKEAKPSRGQKAGPKTVNAATKGKKKANTSPSPIKEAAKKPSTRRAAKEPTPVKPRGRTATRNVTEAPAQAVGRTRRR